MSPSQRETLLYLASALHFLQGPATAYFARRLLELQAAFDELDAVPRRIVHVLGIAVTLTVNGLGVVVLAGMDELARGTRLSLALCAFLALFWGFRFGAQLWYAQVWPRSLGGTIAHWALLAIFFTQTAAYALAAVL